MLGIAFGMIVIGVLMTSTRGQQLRKIKLRLLKKHDADNTMTR